MISRILLKPWEVLFPTELIMGQFHKLKKPNGKILILKKRLKKVKFPVERNFFSPRKLLLEKQIGS